MLALLLQREQLLQDSLGGASGCSVSHSERSGSDITGCSTMRAGEQTTAN